MKNIFLAVFAGMAVSVSAQNSITIIEDSFTMSKGFQPGFQLDIPQADLAAVTKNWLKYISNKSKGKATVTEGENRQPDAVNTNISPFPFFVYSKLLATTEVVRLSAWFAVGDTQFLSKKLNTDQDLAVQKYLNDFAVAEYQSAVQAKLKTEQNKQQLLEKELNDLIKEEEKSTKKINESNRSIDKSNSNIADNNNGIQNTLTKIEKQRDMIAKTASDPNANKGAKKTMNDLNKQKDKLQKQNVTENKNIEAMKLAISNEERNIATLKEKQNFKKAEIEQQKQTVSSVQIKLQGIK